MITGHGDDIHGYEGVRMNFSSNIYAHADITPLVEHLRSEMVRICNYPEPEPLTLEAKIAEKEGVEAECVIVTNGATDGIYLAAEACRDLGISHHHIIRPTFAEYEDACRNAGLLIQADADEDTDAVWICNPNNPTGECIDTEGMLMLAKEYGTLIIDQSYECITLCRMMTAREAVDAGNIIQIHSMTKTCAIPGLRLGYIVTSRRYAKAIRKCLRPWSVNALAISAGHYILDNDFKAIKDIEEYLAEAQRLRDELDAIEGVSVMPTDTNFMLCELSVGNAAGLKNWLAKNHGILIRDASNFRTLTPRHFRIAAQSKEENDTLINAIRLWTSIPH
ncbi:MAG: aminotransferase class I/II-fold pyridoxal phosphate-dependent enzyme [Prevotella sp.]